MADIEVAPRTANILAEIGIEIAPGDIVTFGDLGKAERGYIHHSTVPVALAAYAAISPAFARGRFPKLRLLELVAKRPSMDEGEAIALAAVCGVGVAGPFWGNPKPFAAQLEAVLARYDLWPLFHRQSGDDHYAIRPRGYDEARDDLLDPDAVVAWRRVYKTRPAPVQMMIATIVWLYRGGADQTWLHRLPAKWHAADAIATLADRGALQDWARLVALYPGW